MLLSPQNPKRHFLHDLAVSFFNLDFTFLSNFLAHINSVASIARPIGIIIKAGPGSIIIAIPINNTVNRLPILSVS